MKRDVLALLGSSEAVGTGYAYSYLNIFFLHLIASLCMSLTQLDVIKGKALFLYIIIFPMCTLWKPIMSPCIKERILEN